LTATAAQAAVKARRCFRDGKIQRLEKLASDIAVGLAVLAAAKTEQRLNREAEQRRMEEERRQRELAARIKCIEEYRRLANRAAAIRGPAREIVFDAKAWSATISMRRQYFRYRP
jgi:chromatin segregation and condensation protein Rec8/ScpA/Scc1 (kleisin family)